MREVSAVVEISGCQLGGARFNPGLVESSELSAIFFLLARVLTWLKDNNSLSLAIFFLHTPRRQWTGTLSRWSSLSTFYRGTRKIPRTSLNEYCYPSTFVACINTVRPRQAIGAGHMTIIKAF